MTTRTALRVPRHWERALALAVVLLLLQVGVPSALQGASATPARSPGAGRVEKSAAATTTMAAATTPTSTTMPTSTTVPTSTTTPPYGFGPDGAISGVVTGISSDPVANVQVCVYVPSASPAEAGFATTGSDGTYEVTSLRPGVYWVCFGTDAAGASATGYQTQCYHNVPWADFGHDVMPYGVVTVVDGSTTSGVDATLQPGAEISGSVTGPSGRPLDNVPIEVNSTTHWWAQRSTITAGDGTYSFTGLAPSNYYVCFTGSQVSEPGSLAGDLGQCYNSAKNVPWQLNKRVKGETAVVATVGRAVADIDAQLNPASGIAGRVTNSASVPLTDVLVQVYYQGARPLPAGGAFTGANGRFSVLGLPAGRYHVCFTAGPSTPPLLVDGHPDGCYGNSSPWNGHPSPPVRGARSVVTEISEFTKVNEKLN
jgi:hypothetical protein